MGPTWGPSPTPPAGPGRPSGDGRPGLQLLNTAGTVTRPACKCRVVAGAGTNALASSSLPSSPLLLPCSLLSEGALGAPGCTALRPRTPTPTQTLTSSPQWQRCCGRRPLVRRLAALAAAPLPQHGLRARLVVRERAVPLPVPRVDHCHGCPEVDDFPLLPLPAPLPEPLPSVPAWVCRLPRCCDPDTMRHRPPAAFPLPSLPPPLPHPLPYPHCPVTWDACHSPSPSAPSPGCRPCSHPHSRARCCSPPPLAPSPLLPPLFRALVLPWHAAGLGAPVPRDRRVAQAQH